MLFRTLAIPGLGTLDRFDDVALNIANCWYLTFGIDFDPKRLLKIHEDLGKFQTHTRKVRRLPPMSIGSQ
jgi:hypothetical protein